MEAWQEILVSVGTIVLGVIALRVFFTLWRVVHKRLHPEQPTPPYDAPEVAFRGLKKKTVDVHMKNGEVLACHKYRKTLIFGDGEFGTCTLLYFELESPEGRGVFVCGSDIVRIETCE